MNQQMHNCNHVQSHIIVLHQHVLVTLMTIIGVSYNKNTYCYIWYWRHLSYIVVQLLVYELYCCYTTPVWWSREWQQMSVKNNNMWLVCNTLQCMDMLNVKSGVTYVTISEILKMDTPDNRLEVQNHSVVPPM